MSRRTALDLIPVNNPANSSAQTDPGNVFEQQFIRQLLVAFTPRIKNSSKR
jgi:hypothetical protein